LSSTIKRGDIYRINPPPAEGSVQQGFRPCLVIQNNTGNIYSPVTIVAVCTTKKLDRLYDTDVLLTAEETGLRENSKVMCNQIITIPKTNLGIKVGTVPQYKMDLVDKAIKISLGLK